MFSDRLASLVLKYSIHGYKFWVMLGPIDVQQNRMASTIIIIIVDVSARLVCGGLYPIWVSRQRTVDVDVDVDVMRGSRGCLRQLQHVCG